MHPLIQAQVAAAQASAEKLFDDNPKVDFDSRKLRYGRESEIQISAPGDVVTIEITNSRPIEGPKLGGETKQSGSTLHAANGPESWGKPNRR